VLGGTRSDRALEGADLYREGYAPRLVISSGGRERAELVLAARGIHVPTEAETMRNVMIHDLDIPASAVEILPEDVDNTAQEADNIRAHLLASHWTHLIVITGRATTRRAGFAFRRALGRDIKVTVRASRYDTYRPARWWTTRADIRTTLAEFPKLIAYWLGLKS
jgi:uncharacterized SAM-binding protein YcdF (DUF218 family)